MEVKKEWIDVYGGNVGTVKKTHWQAIHFYCINIRTLREKILDVIYNHKYWRYDMREYVGFQKFCFYIGKVKIDYKNGNENEKKYKISFVVDDILYTADWYSLNDDDGYVTKLNEEEDYLITFYLNEYRSPKIIDGIATVYIDSIDYIRKYKKEINTISRKTIFKYESLPYALEYISCHYGKIGETKPMEEIGGYYVEYEAEEDVCKFVELLYKLHQ